MYCLRNGPAPPSFEPEVNYPPKPLTRENRLGRTQFILRFTHVVRVIGPVYRAKFVEYRFVSFSKRRLNRKKRDDARVYIFARGYGNAPYAKYDRVTHILANSTSLATA